MVRLSYTSLSALHNGHEWLNKQMGIKVPEYPFLKEGKDDHRILQDHVSGKKKHKHLSHIKKSFPIVEEVDFDERCKFTFYVKRDHGIIDDPLSKAVISVKGSKAIFTSQPMKGDYEIIGFYDGRTEDYSRTMEGKFSSIPWSPGKFKKDVQRKIYALSNEGIKEQFIITGQRDLNRWKDEPPEIYKLKPTKQDKLDAIEWIMKGIKILEKGDFTGGLDKKGKCTGCFWNMARYRDIANCNFK